MSPAKSTKASVEKIPLPPIYKVESPPDTITDQNDLQAWKDLFMARRAWALKIVEDCTSMSGETQERYKEVEVIGQAINVAISNTQAHITPLDRSLAEAQNWSSELQKDHKDVVANLDKALDRFKKLNASPLMIKFIHRDSGKPKAQASLDDLLEIEDFKSATSGGAKALSHVAKTVADLSQTMDRLMEGVDNVLLRADGEAKTLLVGQHRSESVQLLEDIEALARRINSDYENVLGYANNPKNISQASRSALLHTKNFLPTLGKRAQEMHGLLNSATEMRNKAATESFDLMQAITTLNAMCGDFNARLNNLTLSDDDLRSFEYLEFADRLPVTYASFVAEAIRRREWNEKIKTDSSTLANEMAVFQDEEEKRRKRWQKATGAVFWSDKSERKVLGLEVNLLGDEEQWPPASKDELQEYLQTLKAQAFSQETIKQVSQLIADLSNPTKLQNKRTKAFKNGSFHEAAIGRSTLLVRGDDDLLRTLQDDKTRLESKYKGAESRIRRLEDLLHRQMSKTPTAASFQPSPDSYDMNNTLGSPRLTDQFSRRSSVSSRRFSATQGPEEKAIAQKLINLEAELIAERERASGLEKEALARANTTNDIRGQMEEANSTKQDLLQNLEAQQNEFSAERRSLELEIRDLKAKIESYEDDMDRIIGSRENEKSAIDERVRSLQQELERARAESLAEAEKTQGQIDFLRNDAKLQRESNEALAKQLERAQEDAQVCMTRAERAEQQGASHARIMHMLYSVLIPDLAIPTEIDLLTEGLLSTARDLVNELGLHRSELQLVRSNSVSVGYQLTDMKMELKTMEDKFKMEEVETFQLREILSSERAKFQALETEMADERSQLSQLRAKFAAGETGSEALRNRVEEEERKVTALSEELAGRRSRVGSLEEELRSVQERLQSSDTKLITLGSRFEARTGRAKDLTQRLYAQNDRLRRLLERMSYSITREGESMIIQRIPKNERNSANDSSDPGSSIRRSISGITKPLDDSGDLELLYWMQNSDTETEQQKFEAYLNAMGSFDVEAFCEAILKRVKEAEHAARKYTRDGRAYREKYHRAQKEAHEKIAFKSFKEGDLALFLPTRNQATGAWAAFNVGAPHYFLHEQDSHRLRSRDWLLARIHKIDERVVDLAKSMTANAGDGRSIGEASNGGDSYEDDNPFDLSDGLRWYLIEASEEKPGAPSTPGLGKSTVAATSVDATGTIRRTKKTSTSGVEGVSKTLTRSLDSRRSSSNSKKAVPFLNTNSMPPASLSDAGGISKPVATDNEIGESSTNVESVGTNRNRLDITGAGATTPPKMPDGSSNEVRDSSATIDDLLGP